VCAVSNRLCWRARFFLLWTGGVLMMVEAKEVDYDFYHPYSYHLIPFESHL
jgi:hypothetical protein